MTPEQREFEIYWTDKMKAIAEQQLKIGEAISELTASVTRYVDAATARMATMEANLDALIRLITAEHTNGKGGAK